MLGMRMEQVRKIEEGRTEGGSTGRDNWNGGHLGGDVKT